MTESGAGIVHVKVDRFCDSLRYFPCSRYFWFIRFTLTEGGCLGFSYLNGFQKRFSALMSWEVFSSGERRLG